MDKMIPAKIGRKTYHFNYSLSVMFDVIEKYESVARFLEIMEADNRAGFEAVRWIAAKLAEDGELCRREMGHDHREMMRAEDISERMRPGRLIALKSAVMDAIRKGYEQDETSDDEDVDIGLLEIEEKKTEAKA